jgi:hypothetical protein
MLEPFDPKPYYNINEWINNHPNFCNIMCKCNIDVKDKNHIIKYHKDLYTIIRILLIRPKYRDDILIAKKHSGGSAGCMYHEQNYNETCLNINNLCKLHHHYYCDKSCNMNFNIFTDKETYNLHLIICHKYTAYCDDCDKFLPTNEFNEHIKLNHKAYNYCYCCDSFDTYLSNTINNTTNNTDNNIHTGKRKRDNIDI